VAAIVEPRVTARTAPQGRLTPRELLILGITLAIVATAALMLVLSTTSTVSALG
jgi:heme O synthase-like polyprenyltransferase